MSDAEKLAERIATSVISELKFIHYVSMGSVDRSDVESKVIAHIAPLLARNAALEAVLRECRKAILQGSTSLHELVARIDALTAKGAGQ